MKDPHDNQTTAPLAGWPAWPAGDAWPPVLTEIQAAQYLHLDDGRSVESAKRTLRYVRRRSGLPSSGRVARTVLYRRAAIDAWLAGREKTAAVGG